MAKWQVKDFYNKIVRDLDLENEVHIQAKEFIEYINDALREVNASLIKLGMEDKYYMAKGSLTYVGPDAHTYRLPADIYGDKIFSLIYDDGSKLYPIKRVKGTKMFQKVHDYNKYGSQADDMQYIIFPSMTESANLVYITPLPASSSTVVNNTTVWYVREFTAIASTVTLGSSTALLDCPEEFINFAMTHVKRSCVLKEVGHPLTSFYLQETERLRAEMMGTLIDQTHDMDNKMEADASYYEEHI